MLIHSLLDVLVTIRGELCKTI